MAFLLYGNTMFIPRMTSKINIFKTICKLLNEGLEIKN